MSDIILGVSGIALDAGRLLLAKRGRGPYAGCWSLPGGKVNFLESHRIALVREFREETGLEVEVGKPAGIAEMIDWERSWHYVILSYFVGIVGGRLRPGDDAAAVRWADRDELSRLPLTPQLERRLQDYGVWN